MLAHIPVATVLVAEPIASLRGVVTQLCRAPARWCVDGVTFELLHPAAASAGSRNDRSCVLAVHGAYGRALLTGDIEVATEAELVARLGGQLGADVISVPHHGSATSSSPAFVRAVHPAIALIAAGYGNRYGLPRARVVARYRAHGARVLNTADVGAVSVRLGRGGIEVGGYRATHWGFWRRAPR